MIRDLLPPNVRRVIYVALSTAFALEAVWDVVPAALEGRILQTLAALGFVLAATNTPVKEG